MLKSKRVDAVKQFATENNDKVGWVDVADYSDVEIYHIVKRCQSEESAIRKMAAQVGAEVPAKGKAVPAAKPAEDEATWEIEIDLAAASDELDGEEPVVEYYKNGNPKPAKKATATA